MRQRFLCLIVLYLPLLLIAQPFDSAKVSSSTSKSASSGIKWVEGLTWQQILKKANKENKYIFVDCYATWCVPCKKMDKDVYTVDSVGDFLNKGFISVKLQMDVTNNDNTEVKSWYKTAKDIGAKYRITEYPSYLFFAPNGEAVSKEVGYKDPVAFIQVARNATDPSKQYLVLLKKYKQGKLDNPGIISLIKMAKQIGDTADYRQLLNSYYAYLSKQKKEKLYTKENIEFVASTIEHRNQALFSMFYPNGKDVNRVMQNGWYSQKVVDKIIDREKLQPFLNISRGITEPDWNALYQWIAKDYNTDFAARNVAQGKMLWYGNIQQDALKFTRALNDKIEKYGTDTTDRGEDFVLNNAAYLIWLNVGKTPNISADIIEELNRVCVWMEGVVRRGKTAAVENTEYWHTYMDTYANLLYKVGRTAEAIQWQEMAIAKLKETVKDEKVVESLARFYGKRLDKMKRAEPTWPIDAK